MGWGPPHPLGYLPPIMMADTIDNRSEKGHGLRAGATWHWCQGDLLQ